MSSSVAVWFVEGTRKKTRMNARALKPLFEAVLVWDLGRRLEGRRESWGGGLECGCKREMLLTRIGRAVSHDPS